MSTTLLVWFKADVSYRDWCAERMQEVMSKALGVEREDGHWIEYPGGTRSVFEHHFLIDDPESYGTLLRPLVDRHRDIFERHRVFQIQTVLQRMSTFETGIDA